MKQLFLSLFFFFIPLVLSAQNGHQKRELSTGEERVLAIVHRQLEAYNKKDIDAFLENFSDDIKVFIFPCVLAYEGKENLRESYSRVFDDAPKLHCTILSEIVAGNKVIHEESVVFSDPDNPDLFICIYIVEDEEIIEMYLM